jgi:hypothetical protein
MRIAKVATLGFVAFVALACSGVSIPTPPPGVPTLPPGVPTLPPGVPTLPPGVPTLPPGASVDPGAGMCRLLSAAEVGAVMGTSMAISESDSDSCTYTNATTFATLNVRTETGDLTAPRFLLGDTAQEITVAGLSALAGTFASSPLVYVQRGNDQLVLQGVLLGTDPAALAKVVQLANTAASRW